MNQPTNRKGTVLLLALGWTAILAVVAAVALGITHRRHRQVFQTASWHDSLYAAESGVDMAVSELRKGLKGGTPWAGWLREDGTAATTPGTSPIHFASSALLRQGEGGQRSWVKVQVDAPATLRDASGEQWYRIRSIGYAEVPGGSVVTGEGLDRELRKIDFRADRKTGEALYQARASREIEAIVKPVGSFRAALIGDVFIDMNNHDIVVDSYDSRSDSKSTNGQYDLAKRQQHGDIATNGETINAANAHIHGNASTDGGEVLGSGNVTGQVRDDFYQELLPVARPTMVAEAGSPTTVNQSTMLAARAGTPTQYVLGDVNLGGAKTLHIQGAPDGSETFAQILVNGDVNLGGNGQIILDPGVHVRIYVAGNVDITSNGLVNPNRPLNFQVYGLARPAGDPPGTMKISGTGGFRGAAYAPNYDLSLMGSGAGDSVSGAFVARSISMCGEQSVYYDEALGEGGLVSDFRVVSWFEDAH
jgi:hypothetical protein